MTITRRSLEEKKTRFTSSRTTKKIENKELNLFEFIKGGFYKATLPVLNLFPSWGLLLFWIASALESSLFYIYVSLFSPILRPLIFEGKAHELCMAYLGELRFLPTLKKYQVIDYIDILFNWLSTWDHNNQLRFLAFCSSFIFGYIIYRGYEVCPTYSIINYYLGKYPNFGIMMGSVISSTLGGVFGGYLLHHFANNYQIIPQYILEGLKFGDYRFFPLSSFFGELLLSFLYSLGVSIVCRTGPGFFGAAELSWFSNANIAVISQSLRAPGNLSLTYSALYGSYSGDFIGAVILGSANIMGTLLMSFLLYCNEKSHSKKKNFRRKASTRSKQK